MRKDLGPYYFGDRDVGEVTLPAGDYVLLFVGDDATLTEVPATIVAAERTEITLE
jgi:hypothetical protein